MTRSGRPLRFLAIMIAAWIGLRIFMLWPQAPGAALPFTPLATPALATVPTLAQKTSQLPMPGVASTAQAIDAAAAQPTPSAHNSQLTALALAGMIRFDRAQIAAGPPGEPIAPPPPRSFAGAAATATQQHRWSADLWLVARNGHAPRAGFGGGELGGSQAGARVAYMIDRRRRLAAFVRADTPLSGKGRETAAGLDWQPTRLPVRIVAEARVPLDGGKAAPAAGLVGGFGPTEHGGVRLEGYGQAGVIVRNGVEGFADGAIRATRPLGTLAGLAFDLGAGGWGGAQRDAARLDLGPTLGATVPIGHHAIRVTLDWRERVAGHARPGSGPALTIGASF